jgi:hypothetical protein
MIYVVSTIMTVGKSFTGIFIHDSQLKMESGIEIINFPCVFGWNSSAL